MTQTPGPVTAQSNEATEDVPRPSFFRSSTEFVLRTEKNLANVVAMLENLNACYGEV